MNCYHYELNKLLTHNKKIQGVVIAKNKKEAKELVLKELKSMNKYYDDKYSKKVNSNYLKIDYEFEPFENMPKSKIEYNLINITKSQVIDMSFLN